MWLDTLISILEKLLRPFTDKVTENIKQNQEIIVHRGDRIALKARSNGRYVQANNDTTTGDLIARGAKVDSWENFEIVDSEAPFSYVKNKPIHYGDKIGLKALSNNYFVGVNYQDSQHILTSCVGHVEEWETFTLVVPPRSNAKQGQVLRYGDRIALQANSGEYVMSHKEKDDILFAVARKIDTWETFIVINPKDPK
jgi:hypothetical protein